MKLNEFITQIINEVIDGINNTKTGTIVERIGFDVSLSITNNLTSREDENKVGEITVVSGTVQENEVQTTHRINFSVPISLPSAS